MAEYINKNELLKALYPLGVIDNDNFSINAKVVKDIINKVPTIKMPTNYKLFGDYILVDAINSTDEYIKEAKNLLFSQCLSTVEMVLSDNKEILFSLEKDESNPHTFKCYWKILLPTESDDDG